MLEYEDVFRRKELQDIFASGEVKPLDDLYLLEDVALTIKELDRKKDFYKGYKKKKSQDVSDAIKVIDNKVKFYKSIMVSTLESNNEKSVKFPGSCNISSRNQKSKWVVNDEEEFIVVLQEAQKAGEDVEDVLEKVVQYNIRKREASKLLEIWDQSGKLEGFFKKAKHGSDIIIKEPAKKTVAIKFLEDVEEDVDNKAEEVSVPIKDKKDNISISSDTVDYDSL